VPCRCTLLLGRSNCASHAGACWLGDCCCTLALPVSLSCIASAAAAADCRGLLPRHPAPCDCSWDNATHDLIVAVGDEFASTLGTRWVDSRCLLLGTRQAQLRRLDYAHLHQRTLVRWSRLAGHPCPLHVLTAGAHHPLVCRYVVRDLLGQGTFGQVFKCVCADDADGEESSAIAIKVGASRSWPDRSCCRCLLVAGWSIASCYSGQQHWQQNS